MTATVPPQAGPASVVALDPPYPTPTAITVTVGYRRPPGSGRATLQLLNVLGQTVGTWPIAAGGSGTVTLSPEGLAAGVYFCTLRVPGWAPVTRRLSVAR